MKKSSVLLAVFILAVIGLNAQERTLLKPRNSAADIRADPVDVTYRSKGDRKSGFKTGNHDSRYPLAIDLGLRWNSFIGGTADYYHGSSVAVDSLGNIYVTGTSSSTWGSPIRPFSGSESNAFVAKFDASGALQWNTFLGGAGINYWEETNGEGIAVDTVGNVYVTGYSGLTWGSPIRAFAGWEDAFVAKLDTNGNLWWNTFLGSANWDDGNGIAVDTIGNVYVTGQSYDTWGSPVHPFNGRYTDAFVVKLNTYGTMQWNTFLQNNHDDAEGNALAVDASANVYVTGDYSDSCHCSYFYGFVAKFDPYGTLEWNTFLGGTDDDEGYGIAVDTVGNVYVAGESWATWGSPIRPYSGDADVFVAKLDTNGNLLWNTFLGGLGTDWGNGIAVDTIGNVHVTGSSWKTWGSPIRPYSGGGDAFAAKLNTSGTLQWNAFLGGAGADYGYDLALNSIGNVYVTGYSDATWGSPICPYSGETDVFVAKIGKGYNLAVTSGPNGTTNPAPGTYSYDVGTTAFVSAIADSGYIFDKWTGNVPAGQETSAIVSILMNADKSIKANFKAGYYLTISSDPHGTTNPAPGTYVYNPGSTASVSAIADNGYIFDRWTGDVPAGQETSATVSILMDTPKLIRATFKAVYGLTISSGPHGTTNPAPGRYLHKEGSIASVSAIADSECVFDRWTGDVPAGQETSAIVSILMDADKSIQANFKLVNPPSNLTAVRLTNRSVTQTEYIVDLTWAANPDNTGLSITTYRVYQKSGDSWVKLADLSSNALTYRVRNVPKTEQTFGVASVTDGG
ncbi:MAG: SBBP repeat-containing protein, partial [Candidatus Aminicenantes bacterium]|nr:SBBP repeat-containing protein [Candidatus Aminicenantes bacterium]